MEFKTAIDGVAARAEKAAQSKSLHEEADGFLHCDRCGQRVQTFFRPTKSSETMIVYCKCRCDEEEERAEKQALKEQEKQRRIEFLRSECFGLEDSTLKRWTFQSSDGKSKDVEAAAHRFCDNFPKFRKNGKGLMLYGGTGTGKTFTAACIANELIGQGVAVKMTNFPKLINKMQESFEGRQKMLDGLNRFDLLIIDDLAAERNTEYVNEIVYTVIDSRYSSGLPLIVTTNISPKDMLAEGAITRNRIYSRLYAMCYAVEVKGEDRRKKAAKGTDELRKLLGV